MRPTIGYLNYFQDSTAFTQTDGAAGAIAASGDSITGFGILVDDINFNTASLSTGASAGAPAVGGQNGWDADTAGVYIANFKLDSTAGATTATAVSTAIGTVNFDAVQTVYFAIESITTADQ